MRPVHPWFAQAILPYPGETPSDYWGPLEADFAGQPAPGYLVLSNFRIAFVLAAHPSAGPPPPPLAVPLEQIQLAQGAYQEKVGWVYINNMMFRFGAPTEQDAAYGASAIAHAILEARNRRLWELYPPRAPAPPPTG